MTAKTQGDPCYEGSLNVPIWRISKCPSGDYPRSSILLKVLHVIPSLSLTHGGPSFALPLIARSLVRAGVQIDVATTDDDGRGRRISGAVGERVEIDGYRVFYFPKQTEFYKVSFPFRRWISAHATEYGLVHVHALFSHTSTCAAREAYSRRVPYIVRPLGVLNRWGTQNRRRLIKSLSLRFIEGPILRRAAAMHYTSRAEQAEAEQAGAVVPAAVIPLGLDLTEFLSLPGSKLFLERFPQAAGRTLILFLSRLDAKKGLDLLLPAFAAVKQRHHQVMLVIAGSGEKVFTNNLRAKAERLGLVNDVLWPGFLGGREKLSALAASTVFVLPSYSENFGIALVEALAAGLPCISTSGVAVSEDIRERDAGLVVPPQAAAITEALDKLLESTELRQRLSFNARQLAHDRFSSEAMGMALHKLYKQVLKLKKLKR